MDNPTIKLTQFSPGAGCGCKISPQVLENILKTKETFPTQPQPCFEKLLVGHETKDDAAVYLLDSETALISTTDFFTPIVDDPFDFGRIAATNAISDVWAMGGRPVLAIAILGWPLSKLPAEMAAEVIAGAREVCARAAIPLAGGHSIDISDPVFGLAVNGVVSPANLKRNSSATPGCSLFLTKPLGVGIITTATKRGLAAPDDVAMAITLMTTLNQAGANFGKMAAVKAMTDVTGFGLLGHLLEMCEGSGVTARLDFQAIPKIDGIIDYIRKDTIPGGTHRNLKSYGGRISFNSGIDSRLDHQRTAKAKATITVDSVGDKDWTEEEIKALLCDPQTSGGLLVAVEEAGVAQFLKEASQLGLALRPIGKLIARPTE